jgi:riboflavin kinase/FMN adenylyltransferase
VPNGTGEVQRIRLHPPGRVPWSRTALAIGNFDGVHLGHQALVAAAVSDAERNGGSAAALTFDPHPARVLKPEAAPAALLTLEQKAEILGELGIASLAVLEFDREVAALDPHAFAARVLRDTLDARLVVVGRTFRFGRGRAGDVDVLRRVGSELGFEVHDVAPVQHEGQPISSTRVRDAVTGGRVEEAAVLLGRPVFVDGTVVQGEGRGRTLGIPTANIKPVNELLPRQGVYAGLLSLQGADPWPAVVNLGRKPTFGNAGTTLEAHALADTGDLYGRTVRLAFVAWLREERRFPGPDALVAQIREDVERARAMLASRLGL